MKVSRVGLLALGVLLGASSFGLSPDASVKSRTRYAPAPDELRQSYERADELQTLFRNKAYKLRITPHWFDKGRRFWYRNDLKEGGKEFIVVDAAAGKRLMAFDHGKLAEALSHAASKSYLPSKLPFSAIEFSENLKSVTFDVDLVHWKCDLKTYSCTQIGTSSGPAAKPDGEPSAEMLDAPTADQLEASLYDPDAASTQRRERDADMGSPDGKFTVTISDGNIHILAKDGGKEVFASKAGLSTDKFVGVSWAPDSKTLVGICLAPGDHKEVYLIESSPKGGGRAVLHKRPYDLPGDKLDTFDLYVLDPVKLSETKVDMEPIDTGDSPEIRWKADPRFFTYEKTDRGHGRFRVIEGDTQTGATRALVDDKAKTFIDITSQYVYYCKHSDEIIWRSEQDGWGQLYLTDGTKGAVTNQITKGPWVVRGVDRIDEHAREIYFHASGMNEGQDPYFLQYYRINFNGTGLVALTDGNGNHSIQFSPIDKYSVTSRYVIDTYSRVDQEPVHELRRVSDGKLVCQFETADISDLKSAGWQAPEVFSAKGRDGKTDIWGVVFRPLHMDPTKKYPIIENIYAGPQDSFVPKSFGVFNRMQSLAELGFIVVQIDGMGTRNRSKAFHDVCWKNLADAGFPDRILWMKSLALRYPYIDLDKVGVYGTSAGGQNSTGAVLFHPEFYKVAVSSAGCHDNRMDKVWWNEQWMGYPVGPWYAEQSNITNAAKLKGRLLLMVGEMDTNVPPESTLRLVDALLKAKKDFEFLMLPGFDHTDGGPMGERKRRDFFVHYLLGLEPPERNSSN
ncbi:MAG: prolyl oligopeptidase family serine peptidase [Fimbriimonas sp.]|nr:prolyl oligopeptidase family serine peptidase [Fimbriimonas sp.]